MRIESKEGPGCAVKFTLLVLGELESVVSGSLSSAETRGQASPANDEQSRVRKEHAPFTILVVEDDPSDTELILPTLEQAELKAVEGDLEIEVRRQPKGL